MKSALAISALLLSTVGDLRAQDRQEFHVARAAQPPTIDGVLNDEVWRHEPLPTVSTPSPARFAPPSPAATPHSATTGSP